MSVSPQISQGLTFDDVLLIPRYSEILPKEAKLTTRFTRGITLNSPVVSAAMDTVTESSTAIAMAQSGGIGVIHKNLGVELQAQEVGRVKKSEAGMVTDPICVDVNKSVKDVLGLMAKHNISGLPVLEGSKLVGIVTGRDIRFENDLSKSVTEVMTQNVIYAENSISSEEAVAIMHKHRIEKLPLIDGTNRSLKGLFTIKDIEKSKAHPFASKDSDGRLLVAAAIGVGHEGMERAEALLAKGADALVLDSAHGHSKRIMDSVKELIQTFRAKYDFQIVAGNVATAAGAKALIDSGVDALKVGIGPGSICTTRIIAGIGVPQLSAIMNCYTECQKADVPLIADGGVKFSGDIVKALAAGAASVMIGSLFAGTDEAPGELIIYQGKSYKSYRGMGSIGAMSQGSKDRYQQDDIVEASKLVPEGIEGRVAYKGPLAHSVSQLTGGIRAAMGYLGAADLQALREQAEFVAITNAGLRESHTHDVQVTREAPNYKFDSL